MSRLVRLTLVGNLTLQGDSPSITILRHYHYPQREVLQYNVHSIEILRILMLLIFLLVDK